MADNARVAMLLPLLVPAPPADLVVVNAKVWTDGHLQKHDFIEVREGRFTYVGRRRNASIGPNTVTVDAKGRVVVPGLIDCHTHMMEAGVGMVTELQLRGAKSKADFIRRIKEWSDRLPPGKWVVGNGWSAESWPEQQDPTRAWVDQATGDRPAILYRMDGHSAVANSAALRLAKITKEGPPNPAGGVIDRDASGEPTGMLRETAVSLVVPPSPSDEDRYRGFLAAVKEANRWGITMVGDIASIGYGPLYRRYAAEKDPSLRVAFYGRAGNWDQSIASLRALRPVEGWFEPKGLKAFMDGSLGSRTAYMAAPYTKPLEGQPKNWRGVPMPGAVDGTYAKGFAAAARANLQVIVHAIGDQANHDVLDLFAAVPGLRGRRFRVEHAQHLLPADIPRFTALGVVASLQPYHKVDDGRYCEEVIGPTRSRTSYAFHDLFRAGARVAFGSDFDVVNINPFAGIAAAVTGRLENGKVWVPEQNIKFDQAMLGYTSNASYSMFMETEHGRIAEDYYADFVILDRSPYDPKVDLAKIQPAAVYVEGRRVYGR